MTIGEYLNPCSQTASLPDEPLHTMYGILRVVSDVDCDRARRAIESPVEIAALGDVYVYIVMAICLHVLIHDTATLQEVGSTGDFEPAHMCIGKAHYTTGSCCRT